jgi:RNA polymerase sigma factor (TIGR02999 family)
MRFVGARVGRSTLPKVPAVSLSCEIQFPAYVPAMPDIPGDLARVPWDAPKAAEELLPVVYEELRRVASSKMANEAPGQTLQPTALVHEAWLRLGGDQQPRWQNRAHFFGAAAEAMRRILVENARRKARLRHGGDRIRLSLEDLEKLDLPTTAPEESLLGLDDALRQLEADEPDAARVVTLRFFAGLGMAEIGQMLGVSDRTVKRTWAFARAWLYDRLRPSS